MGAIAKVCHPPLSNIWCFQVGPKVGFVMWIWRLTLVRIISIVMDPYSIDYRKPILLNKYMINRSIVSFSWSLLTIYSVHAFSFFFQLRGDPYIIKLVSIFFLDYTQYNSDTHNACTLTPMNASTQTLSIWISSKTKLANPRDWRSHQRSCAIDKSIAYH